MKYIFWGILVIIGVTLFGIGIKIVFFPINTANKLIETAYDAQDKILNADNAIYNYEWFKQKYQDINASKIQLTNAQASLSSFEESAGKRADWTFEDKTEDSRLRSVVLGLQNYLQTNIADYDARASMATRNIFENKVLPNYIDALTFITK